MRIHTTFALVMVMAFSKAIIAQPMANPKVVVDYVNQYKDIAVLEMVRTRIPASITLAQGILESQCGCSRLATEGHNHFGIKCKSNWTGKVILEDDDDLQECFRFYEDGYESYKDHSNFLLASNRYAFLFDLEITDYRSWAYGLKEAGYATNPTYATQLIDIIEKYNLNQYDRYTTVPVVNDDTDKHEVIETNGIASAKAKEGDTYSRIAIENKMKVSELLVINDLSSIKELHYGDVVYLKPKKNENAKFQTHTVQTGESMRDIAQKYGIKLSVLLERNRLNPGEEPKKGEIITLNKYNSRDVKIRNVQIGGTRTVNMRVEVGERSQTDSIVEAKYNTEVTSETKVDRSLAKIPVPVTDEAYTGNTVKKENQAPYENDYQIDEVIGGELYHYVVKGETIYSITKNYSISAEELKGWNKIKGNNIKIGQKLQVTNHDATNIVIMKSYAMNDSGYYNVQDGDSLDEIASQFALTLEELIDMNKLVKPYDIKVGDSLKVMQTRSIKINRPPFCIVKVGDTLESISRNYEIPVADIKKLNSLNDSKIEVGAKLVLQ
jgi:LysM repeat protein